MITTRNTGTVATEQTGRHALEGFADIHFSGREWESQALCTQADPEAWWPQKGEDARDAKKVCMRCPVREICLNENIDEREGIYGGLGGKQRAALRKRRALGLPDPEPAICDHCSTVYLSTRPDRRFCSPTCQRNQTKPRPVLGEGVCRNCGDRFTRDSAAEKYCKDTCRREAKRARARNKTATQQGNQAA